MSVMDVIAILCGFSVVFVFMAMTFAAWDVVDKERDA